MNSLIPIIVIHDQYNNVRTQSTDTITLWPYSDATCQTIDSGVLYGGMMQEVSGVANFNTVFVAYTKTGNLYLRASDGARTVCSTAVLVTHNTATKLALSASPSPLSVGATSTLTALVQDQYGNTATTNETTYITLSSDGNSIRFTQNGIVVHGSKTFTLSDNTAETVNASITSNPWLTPSPVIAIIFNSTADVTSPTITGTTVTDGAIDIAINSTITVTLSEALGQLYVNGNTVKLYNDVNNNNTVDAGDTLVPVLVNLDDTATKILITPRANLSNAGNYIYRISSGVKDASGNALAANADYDFTTVAAGVGSFGILPATNITNQTTGGVADNTYPTGWEWKIRITLPTNLNHFSLKFNNWASGSSSLTSAGNMRYYSEQIASGVGSAASPVSFATANTYPTNLTVVTDADPDTDGIQTDIHVMVKIPSTTSAGSYTTSYNVKYE